VSVAELREFGLPPESARLMRREIETAELQELSVVTEAAEIAGFSKYRECVDRPDAWNPLQGLVVGSSRQQHLSFSFDRVTLADEAAHLRQHHAEHGDSHGLGGDW